MYPILLQFGSAALYAYPVFIGLAAVIAYGVWVHCLKLNHLPTSKAFTLWFEIVAIAFVGAKVFFAIIHFSPEHSFVYWLNNGGVVFYGGFLFATAYCFWRFPRAELPLWPALKSTGPALAIGHAIGRLGCFFHGCCYGKSCALPWAISVTDPLSSTRPLDTPLHPTQLYESIALTGLFFILLKLQKSSISPKGHLIIYLLYYGIFRFINEFFRADTLRGSFSIFSTSQWVSLGLVSTAICLILFSKKAINRA